MVTASLAKTEAVRDTPPNSRVGRNGLEWPSVVVDEPHAGRNDRGRVVLAPLELPANLPL